MGLGARVPTTLSKTFDRTGKRLIGLYDDVNSSGGFPDLGMSMIIATFHCDGNDLVLTTTLKTIAMCELCVAPLWDPFELP